MKVYFKSPMGLWLYKIVTADYLNTYGRFPLISTEFSEHLNSMGYRATYFSEFIPVEMRSNPTDMYLIGVDIPNDDLIELRLRYSI